MTGEGYRVEKRRPVEPGKWDYVAVIALLFLLALADKCH